jgi:hypothetical protein
MVAAPVGVFKLRHIAASACVALVIIAVITPTAPSVARAITKNIVVFWILLNDGNLFSIKLRYWARFYPFSEKR